MRNKISAIIIDPNYKYNDYAKVKTKKGGEYDEEYFDLRILDSGKNIEEELFKFKGVDSIITIGDKRDWQYLSELPFQFRKKWCHLDKFVANNIVNTIINTFKYNMKRDDAPKLFSFFTCTFNTGRQKLERLYKSMRAQTYNEWNWWILDDSTNGETEEIINSFKDPRITVFKNVSNHGNIGFNKHMIAMLCDGDYLVEVDHDDELTPDCLSYLLKAFNTYANSDFVYSHAIEFSGTVPIIYGEGWGWGEGLTCTDVVNGTEYTFSDIPEITPYSIRTIYAQPNHVRCWKKDFYHKIGGHNPELAVLDDMELLIRTFLYGEMTKIDKVLYLQHEGEGKRGEEAEDGTTQSSRFNEIQRTLWYIKDKYDKQIHKRIEELGFFDEPWDEQQQTSILWKQHAPRAIIMCNVLKP